MQKKSTFKSSKGVISIYVGISIITFIIILTAIYTVAVSVRKNQIKTLIKIKEVYEQNNNNVAIGGTEEEPDEVTIEKLITEVSDNNETVYDKYGNKIVVPAGFKIVSHGTGSGNNVVEYTYDKQDGISTNTPVVQDGIVIQNAEDGNEFVWVPIGKIKNDAEANTTNTTTITLGRYSDFTMPADGSMPTPVQVASKAEYDIPTTVLGSLGYNHMEISSDFIGGNGYNAASSYENAKALNLKEWISTSLDNGGYYIARYEASKNGEKASSKVTNVSSAINSNTTITNGMIWSNISQVDAATAAKAMYPYSAEAKYYSDLINSYTWDTAIIFIQAYSGDIDYANQSGTEINTNIAKAGENADKKCNIQDLAGNIREWSTETATDSSVPATCRGGCYAREYLLTRNNGIVENNKESISFRVTLCIK